MHNVRAAPARILLASFLLASLPAQALDLLSPIKTLFGSDDVIVWQAPGQFVKIVDQDRIKKDRRVEENSHPAELSPGQLSIVLARLKVEAGGKTVPVFTPAEVAVLAEQLSKGLGRATDRQDVVFAVIGGVDGGAKRTTAGRAFVADGKFQVIFGDVHGAVDPDTSDTGHYTEPHRAGKRKDRVTDVAITGGAGIGHYTGFKRERADWVILDIPAAVAAPGAPAAMPVTAPAPVATPALPPSPQGVSQAAPAPMVGAPITPEQQKQLEERRQMAEEMARLRKQVQEQQAAGGGAPATAPPAAPAGKSIEERLKQLQSLHEKKLITDDEYAAKRKALLEEI